MSVYRIGSNSAAWSAKLDAHYAKLKEFIVGELAMMEKLLGHLDEEQTAATREVMLERQYELYYIEGRVEELVKPPYDRIFRRQGLKKRLITRLKIMFPALHSAYRRRCGYEDY